MSHASVLDIVIVGAGLSGLVAARELRAAGRSVLVLDKSRGPGGRMATRRQELPGDQEAQSRTARFDHGAQFFTVRSPEFRAFTDELWMMEIIHEWGGGFAAAPGDDERRDGHPRYRGAGGMNAVCKYLAADTDLLLDCRVESLRFENDVWLLKAGDDSFRARAVLLAMPAPQSLALLDAGAAQLPDQVRRALDSIEYDPCLAALVSLHESIKLPAPGAIQYRGEPIAFLADNLAKGVSPEPTLTIHGGPEFSRAHLEDDPDAAAHLLVEAAADVLKPELVRAVKGHRWRYAQPVLPYADACLFTGQPGPLCFAGDAFGEARVEGAFLSGLSASRALLDVP